MHASVAALWDRYRGTHPDAPTAVPDSFHFCDTPADADLCAQLVLAGRKRASASSVAELRLAGVPIPRAGDLSIVTDWAGEAVAVIRTTAADIRRFGDVDADFARAEGEGDLTLAWWRAAHLAYYQRVLAGAPDVVDDDLEIVCERFELVFGASAA